MGRALFSVSHPAVAPEPVIKTQQEPQVDSSEKWSVWNRFDPDSEDFFQDAEYEAFIDPVHLEQQRESSLGGSSISSESGESTDSEHASPMAVGSDDPAILIRGTYNATTRTWDATIDRGRSGVWMTESLSPPYAASSASSSAPSSPSPIQNPRFEQDSFQSAEIPPFIPPPFLRAPSPAMGGYPDLLRDAPAFQRASPPPLSVPRDEPVSPVVPLSPITLGTPPSSARVFTTPRREDPQSLLTPSPPPSVTPRFYSWQDHPIRAMPSSPTVIRGNSEGLLGRRNRISFARIETTPARVRVPNVVM